MPRTRAQPRTTPRSKGRHGAPGLNMAADAPLPGTPLNESDSRVGVGGPQRRGGSSRGKTVGAHRNAVLTDKEARHRAPAAVDDLMDGKRVPGDGVAEDAKEAHDVRGGVGRREIARMGGPVQATWVDDSSGEPTDSEREGRDAVMALPASARTKPPPPMGRPASMTEMAREHLASQARVLRRKKKHTQRSVCRIVVQGQALDTSARICVGSLKTAFFISVLGTMSETVWFQDEQLEHAKRMATLAVEVAITLILIMEYALRVWSCPCAPNYRGRLRFLLSVGSLFDVVCIAPLFVAFVLKVDMLNDEGVAIDALRVLRIMRLLKFARYSQGARVLFVVARLKADELLTALSLSGLVVILLSVFVFYAEHKTNGEDFPSMVVALYWGVITLTTVGYGDLAPATPPGRSLGALGAVLGIGLFTLPASLLSSGYLEYRQKHQETLRLLTSRIVDGRRKVVLRDAFWRMRRGTGALEVPDVLTGSRYVTAAPNASSPQESVASQLSHELRRQAIRSAGSSRPQALSTFRLATATLLESAKIAGDFGEGSDTRNAGRGGVAGLGGGSRSDTHTVAHALLAACGGSLDSAITALVEVRADAAATIHGRGIQS